MKSISILFVSTLLTLSPAIYSSRSIYIMVLLCSRLRCSFLSLSLAVDSAPVDDDRDVVCSELIAVDHGVICWARSLAI